MVTTIKALLDIADPYEPAAIIGLFENDKQKRKLITHFLNDLQATADKAIHEGSYSWLHLSHRRRKWTERIAVRLGSLKEVEIPIGEFGRFNLE